MSTKIRRTVGLAVAAATASTALLLPAVQAAREATRYSSAAVASYDLSIEDDTPSYGRIRFKDSLVTS